MVFGKIPRWLVIVFAVTALTGFIDASFLTAEHVRGVIPPCSVTGGCERVLTSAYSVIGGIPLAVVGMIYYGLLLVLVVAFFDTYNHKILHLASWFTVGGFLATLYFIFVQAFILHAFCQYCLVSAGASLTLLFISARIMRID